MDKELNYRLNIQLFAENEDENDEDDFLDGDDFDDNKEVEETKKSDNQQIDNEDSPTDLEKKKKEQSQEENARQAKLRREKEQKEREEQIRKEAYDKGKLDATKTNPYTNEPIKDQFDLKIYELQKKISENGGDPINDLSKELAKLEREEFQKKSNDLEEEKKNQANITKDISDFKNKYPKVDANKLINNDLFLKISGGKLGKVPLTQLYEEMLEVKKLILEQNAKEEAEKKQNEEAKKKGSSPSSSGGGNKETKSYSSMSKEEKIKLLRKQGLIR